MKDRSEAVEMAVRSGARRGEPPSRIHCDTSQAVNPENARHGGHIRGCSRSVMDNAGYARAGCERVATMGYHERFNAEGPAGRAGEPGS